MATTENSIMGMMMVVFGIAIMASMLTGMGMTPAPPAPPAPPVATFCCPIEPDVCFTTYEELNAHFIAEHPTIDIDIDWK